MLFACIPLALPDELTQYDITAVSMITGDV